MVYLAQFAALLKRNSLFELEIVGERQSYERAVLPYRLADPQPALANLMLLLGVVSAHPAPASRTWRVGPLRETA
jgi:hypothetical protein